jgi:preprotein translocase subunit SecG
MFLYYVLVTLFVILCFLLATLILVQKGKGSLGLGYLGGSTQMLFGGSGGQDLFQKITWGLGALFMAGSLALALMKTSNYNQFQFTQQIPIQNSQELPINQ